MTRAELIDAIADLIEQASEPLENRPSAAADREDGDRVRRLQGDLIAMDEQLKSATATAAALAEKTAQQTPPLASTASDFRNGAWPHKE